MATWDHWQRAALGSHLMKGATQLAHVWQGGQGAWWGQLLKPAAPPKGPFTEERLARRAMERLVESQPKPKAPTKKEPR